MDQAAPLKIRIFRPGRFVSMEGTEVSFSEADLAAIADAYDASTDPAPLVIGHPRTDDPAYGWVDGLAIGEGGVLIATPKDVEPSFAEVVRKGKYRRVSARFFPPDAPSNPKPGTYYLKHVGFLGAQAPAVSGLGTVQFAEDGDTLTIIMSEKEAPVPKEELSFAERSAALDRREQELAERENTSAEREREAKARAAKVRHDAAVSFATALVASAKLKPVGKSLVVGVLDALDAETEVSFAEAGEMTPAAAFRKLFDSAQPMVSFSEVVPPEKRPMGGGSVSFAAPDGYDVDPDSADLYARAKAIQTENPKLGWMDCVRQAQSA